MTDKRNPSLCPACGGRIAEYRNARIVIGVCLRCRRETDMQKVEGT